MAAVFYILYYGKKHEAVPVPEVDKHPRGHDQGVDCSQGLY